MSEYVVGGTRITDTDGGVIEVLPSSGVMAGNHCGPFVWVTVEPGPASADGTVHLTREMVEELHAALETALAVSDGKP